MKMNQNDETIDMTRKHTYFSKKNIAFQNALNKISNRFLFNENCKVIYRKIVKLRSNHYGC